MQSKSGHSIRTFVQKCTHWRTPGAVRILHTGRINHQQFFHVQPNPHVRCSCSVNHPNPASRILGVHPCLQMTDPANYIKISPPLYKRRPTCAVIGIA